jgi:hypothetical protein
MGMHVYACESLQQGAVYLPVGKLLLLSVLLLLLLSLPLRHDDWSWQLWPCVQGPLGRQGRGGKGDRARVSLNSGE